MVETWVLNADVSRVEAADMRCLKLMCGIVVYDWVRNERICELMGVMDETKKKS